MTKPKKLYLSTTKKITNRLINNGYNGNKLISNGHNGNKRISNGNHIIIILWDDKNGYKPNCTKTHSNAMNRSN